MQYKIIKCIPHPHFIIHLVKINFLRISQVMTSQLFMYCQKDAVQCSFDYWYKTVEDVYEDWNDLVNEKGWILIDDHIHPTCQNEVKQFHNLSDVFILCSIILKYINYLLPSPVYSCFCSQYHLITQHIYRNRQTVFLQNIQDRSDLLHFQMSVHVHIQHPFYYEYSL